MATLVAWVPESTWPPLAELICRPKGLSRCGGQARTVHQWT